MDLLRIILQVVLTGLAALLILLPFLLLFDFFVTQNPDRLHPARRTPPGPWTKAEMARAACDPRIEAEVARAYGSCPSCRTERVFFRVLRICTRCGYVEPVGDDRVISEQ